MQFAVLTALSFAAMEPTTYLTHRFVMHGIAARIHRSHHRGSAGRLEANDAFPVAFSAVAMLATVAAYHGLAPRATLAVVAGVSAYGLVYGLVHDVYIHGRLPLFRHRHRVLERLADAHRLHHRYHGEPYGMLVPIVPARLRRRAAHPLGDAQPAGPGLPVANGSRPSHVPDAA